jgi:hypothetical protein
MASFSACRDESVGYRPQGFAKELKSNGEGFTVGVFAAF